MTYEQFIEAARYAMSKLDPEQVEYGWYIIGKTHLYDLPEEIESALIDGMDEWCNDNDIDPDEWQEEWGVIDVWCDGQKDDDELKESYSESKYPYSTQTKGAMLQGLSAMLELMQDYEDYCKKALDDIAAYYNKIGIKVLSAITEGETANGGDGFVIKLDRSSVEEFLSKNNCRYDDEDPEYINEYKADDLMQLTVSNWADCGENVKMMFETLWLLDTHWKVGDKTLTRPDAEVNITFDSETENTVIIEYHPEIFEAVDNILSSAVSAWDEQSILRCMRYA